MSEVVIDINERRWTNSGTEQSLWTGLEVSRDARKEPVPLPTRIARWLLQDPQPNREAAELMALKAEELPTIIKFIS